MGSLNVALQAATTPKLQSVVKIPVYLVQRDTTVYLVVDVALLVRSDAEIANAMILRGQHVVQDQAQFGVVIKTVNAVQTEAVRILQRKSAARVEDARKERHVVRTNVVHLVLTVHLTGTVKSAQRLQGASRLRIQRPELS